MFYTRIEKHKKIVEIHITLLNSLATFPRDQVPNKNKSYVITGSLVHAEHSCYVLQYFPQAAINSKFF